MVTEKRSFVFPGQGSQKVGMGKDLYEAFPVARRTFEEADENLGFRFSELIFSGSQEELQDTINSQPAIMTTSIACWRVWNEVVGSEAPLLFSMAGHSLGEYTAMVAAGVISFPDGVRLARERGHLMQQACIEQPGKMAAIFGLDEMVLLQVCDETGVSLANINTRDQIVISGSEFAVAQAMDLASARGAQKAIPLKVSGAFHSSLMENAQEGLATALSGLRFRDPNVPIIANTTAEAIVTGSGAKQELSKGLCGCVEWDKSVQNMARSGVTTFLEFGPSVVSGMIKRIDPNVQVLSLSSADSIRRAAEQQKAAVLPEKEETFLSRHKEGIAGVVLGAATAYLGMKAGERLHNRRKKKEENTNGDRANTTENSDVRSSENSGGTSQGGSCR